MALEVIHNPAENTQENEQFRRVVKIIDEAFNKHNYTGILIGNPYNDAYPKFRADAILAYDNGIIIIDFKDYEGDIVLPEEANFNCRPWKCVNPTTHKDVQIKAGNHFKTPFMQLVSYRNAFRDHIVKENDILKQKIDTKKICIANLFRGPINLFPHKVPRSLPYYKIRQETEIGNLLYDLKGNTKYDEELGRVLKALFPGKLYTRDYPAVDTNRAKNTESGKTGETNATKPKVEATAKITESAEEKPQKIIVEQGIQTAIEDFMKTETNDILILASAEREDRDNWAKYLYSISDDYGIPQVESFCHSTRIARRLSGRGIDATSLYSIMYGGSKDFRNDEKEYQEDETVLQVIPMRSNSWLDEKALVIIHEAHLISKGLTQFNLLQFGSGSLLEDLLQFMNPESKRKLVFIGDPYMLSFGDYKNSAMNATTMGTLCKGRTIRYCHQPMLADQTSNKDKLRYDLANSIGNELFNCLSYDFSDGTITELDKDSINEKIKGWFSKPFASEPNHSVLFYKKADCDKTNLWIKNNCLGNGSSIAAGDLLIANNNVIIPDETGFGTTRRVLNGMYFEVLGVKGHDSFSTKLKNSPDPIVLNFTCLSVNCLSLRNTTADVWILDNYLQNIDELSKNEQIALKIFADAKLKEIVKRHPFKKSKRYNQLLADENHKKLTDKEMRDLQTLIENRSSDGEKEKVNTKSYVRQLLKCYYNMYLGDMQQLLRETDPMFNCMFVKYGWAITVHKGVGTEFDEIVIKGLPDDTIGCTNESYFRWLYSGITSVKDLVYINQPQHISPFKDCEVVKIDTSSAPKNKPLLVYNDYKPDERYSELLKPINTNSAGAICELSKILEKSGYLLESAEKTGDYLSKAHYSIPADVNKRLVIDFHNKGVKDNWGVSSIKMEPNTSIDATLIRTAIESLMNSAPANIGETNCPQYIDDIYSKFAEDMSKIGVSLKKIGSCDYQDVFAAKSKEGEAKLRFWYGTSEKTHNKGFIGKIEMFDVTDESIIKKVRDYVSELL